MYQPTPDIEEEKIDLSELFGALVENRWLIVAVTLLALLIGGYQAFTATPIYRASGVLQIEERFSSGVPSLEMAIMMQQYTPAVAEMEILRSRSVLGDVVDNLKLDINARPEYLPYVGAALARRRPADERPTIKVDTLNVPDALRGKSFRLVATSSRDYELFDSEGELLLRGTVGNTESAAVDGGELALFVASLQAEPGQVFRVWRSPRLSAIQSLQGRLSVGERTDWSGILEVAVQGTNPEAIKDQANEIADVYVRKNEERKSEEAQRTLEFLEVQLPIVKKEMDEAGLRLNAFRLEKGSIDLPMETQTVLNTIVSLEQQINQLRQEREKATLAFTDVHPTVVALDRQISQINNEIAVLNAQVRDLPETQQELLGRIRDVEVSTNLYTSLLTTAQELRVVKAGTVGNVRIIDYAITPTSPISPNRQMILAVALFLGLAGGIALAFLRKALKSSVDDPDLIEKQVNIPVYATIAHSKRQDQIFKALKSEKARRAILAVDKPDDPAIESIRNLRTALHFGMMNVQNNTIMIAGPSPAVGKSFISVNLAAVLATNEKKVLLIDGDLRRGHLNEYLGIERKNGLSEFISGDVPIGQVLHQTTVPGLTLIPTGVLPPNPAELLLHKRFANCLSVLAPRYDHIIIDSPPILAVTDAMIVGQMAGGTLLVLKAGEHPMREIELSVKRLQQANVNLRGILFNDIPDRSRKYGAGRYHYEYAYTDRD